METSLSVGSNIGAFFDTMVVKDKDQTGYQPVCVCVCEVWADLCDVVSR